MNSGYLSRQDSLELVAIHVLSCLRVSGHYKILNQIHYFSRALIAVSDDVLYK